MMYPVRFRMGLESQAVIDPDLVSGVTGAEFGTRIYFDGHVITVQEPLEDVLAKLGWETAPEPEHP